MGCQWNPFGFQLHTVSCFIALMLLLHIQECWSLNLEGLALLEFRASVDSDPYGAFMNWNSNDDDPCMWSGVHCVDGKVQMLDLKGLSLGGILAPELGKLSHLKSLVLYKNHFMGAIPKEIGELTTLELLDLRANNLSGTIPAEIGQMLSLKRLLLCNNKFQGSIPRELGKLDMLSEIQFDQNLTYAVDTGIGCLHRKFGHCIWQNSMIQMNAADSFMIRIKGKILRYLNGFPLLNIGKSYMHVCGGTYCENLPSSAEQYLVHNVHHIVNFVRRRLLQESSNLPAAPVSSSAPPEQMTNIPFTQSSGSFPAVPNGKQKQFPLSPSIPSVTNSTTQLPETPAGPLGNGTKHLADGSPGNRWKHALVFPSVAFLLAISAAILCVCQSQGVTTIGPWKTGLSGQLQKAFLTGVPKLNRSELEIACEDFSNIIDNLEDCTVYKGTLSSGVEIAVTSTPVVSFKDWSKHSEIAYRKKIDTLSRVNHKNFINLLGYCEEDEPFLRMMVFEYAPNGTLFEHLHVKEVEHLDWNARMRIIMGTAYCLQYMHLELNPPVALPNLQSNVVFLTDDYAAKIADISFWSYASALSKISGQDDSRHSELLPIADPDTNVYSFGMLLLEIISGKLPYSEDQGSLMNWASEYLNGKRNISYMIDPTLKSFKKNELDVICEVIQECSHQDLRKRPTMKEITAKLREVIAISPDAAIPRLSPLWWAELEILSVEAT